MASEITHIALAARAHHSFKKLDITAFFVGTVFPDIQYLGGIERDKTHMHRPSLRAIESQTSSFLSGVEFHSLADIVREDFYRRSGIYSRIPFSQFVSECLKLYEDHLFYSAVVGWPVVIRYFDSVLRDETRFGVPESNILRWHKILQNYFSQPPSDSSRQKYMRGLGFGESIIAEVNRNIVQVASLPEVGKLVRTFYNHFDELVAKHDLAL